LPSFVPLNWKKYLLHIAKLLGEGKTVQTKTLAESVGVNTRNTRKNIQKLIAKGLIAITGEHTNRTIFLTEKGRKESIKL
jgi:Mn-dependent DtxR family transcriptional regulator